MTCENFQTLAAGLGAANQLTITPDFPFDNDEDLRLDIYNYDSLSWTNIPIATGRTVDVGAPGSTANDFYSWEVFLDGSTKRIRTVLATANTTPALPAGNTAKHPPVPNAGTSFPINGGAPANVRLYRKTSIDRGDLPAIFYPGAAVKAEDLNNNFEALRRVVEEGACFENAEFEARYWNQINLDNSGETWFSNSTTAWPGNDTTVTSTAGGDVQWSTFVQEAQPVTNVTGKTWFRDSDNILHIWNGTTWQGVNGASNDDTIYESVFFVSPDGSDFNNGHSVTRAMRTIRHAVDSANGTVANKIGGFNVTTQASGNLTAGTFTIAQTATSGGGTGAVASIVATATSAQVTLISGGTGFAQGDTVTFARAGTYGGDTDIVITVANVGTQAAVANALVFVFPGVYAERLPIRMQAGNMSIVGQAIRSCFVHPNVEDVPNYAINTPCDPELGLMFEMGDGSYISGFTFAGMKAAGNTQQAPIQNPGLRRWNQVTRNNAGQIELDADRSVEDPGIGGFQGLPRRQGWVAGLWTESYGKSPYIQNCTVFSDSAIDNRIANFDSNNLPGEARDETSHCTGGGILCDGNVPLATSPLRSFVVDSFTQINLDGPGILCTNNGYAQLVSFFGTFCHYHAKALNGGQLNLSNCTTDFGRFALIAQGRSPQPLITGQFSAGFDGYTFAGGDYTAGDTAITIDGLTAEDGWSTQNAATFWPTNLPGSTYVMEVDVGGGNADRYLIRDLGANDSGAGTCTVNILSPSPANASTNLGLYRNTGNDTDVRFFRQSYISTGGHTMEFVGSGCDYRAVPELGGQANQANQCIEEGGLTPQATAGPGTDPAHFENKNGGRVYYSGTDENGRFQVGGNADNIVFVANQKTGELTVNADAINPQVSLQMACDVGDFTDTDINVGNIAANPNITLDSTGTINNQQITLNTNGEALFGTTATHQIRVAPVGTDGTNTTRSIITSRNPADVANEALNTFNVERGGAETMRICVNGDIKVGNSASANPNCMITAGGVAQFNGPVNTLDGRIRTGDPENINDPDIDGVEIRQSGRIASRSGSNLVGINNGNKPIWVAGPTANVADGFTNAVFRVDTNGTTRIGVPNGNGGAFAQIANSGAYAWTNNTGGSSGRLTYPSGSSVRMELEDNNGNINVIITGAGGAQKPGGGSWTDSNSERRLKQNLTPVDPTTAWETVKNLPYYSYQFISDPDKTYYGPVVDECPTDMQVTVYDINEEGVEVVRADEEGPLKTYDNLLRDARLFVALQEALKRIETLEAEINALKTGEVADDSNSAALLTLVSNLTTRVQQLESQ